MSRSTSLLAPDLPDIEHILLSIGLEPAQLCLLEEYASLGYLEFSTAITLTLQKHKVETVIDGLIEDYLSRSGSSNSLLQLGLPLYINGHFRSAKSISDGVVDENSLSDHALVAAYLLDMTSERERSVLSRAPGIFSVMEATLGHFNYLAQISIHHRETSTDFSNGVRQNLVAFLPRTEGVVSIPLINLIARSPGHYPYVQRHCIECYTGPPRLEGEALQVLASLCENPDDLILSHWRKNQAHSGLLKILAHYRPSLDDHGDRWNEDVLALAGRYARRFVQTPLTLKLLQATHFSLSMPVEAVTTAPASLMGLQFLLEATRIYPEYVELASFASSAELLMGLHPYMQNHFWLSQLKLRDHIIQYAQEVMVLEGISPQALFDLIENEAQAEFVAFLLADYPASALTHPSVLQNRLESDLGL